MSRHDVEMEINDLGVAGRCCHAFALGNCTPNRTLQAKATTRRCRPSTMVAFFLLSLLEGIVVEIVKEQWGVGLSEPFVDWLSAIARIVISIRIFPLFNELKWGYRSE